MVPHRVPGPEAIQSVFEGVEVLGRDNFFWEGIPSGNRAVRKRVLPEGCPGCWFHQLLRMSSGSGVMRWGEKHSRVDVVNSTYNLIGLDHVSADPSKRQAG